MQLGTRQLLARDPKGAIKTRFCSFSIGRGRFECDFAGDAIDLGLAPSLVRALCFI